MRKCVLAIFAASLIGASSNAIAADVKLPVTKAPPMMTARAAVPMFYVGPSIGVGIPRTTRTMTGVTSIGPEPFDPAGVSSSATSLLGGVFVGVNLPAVGGALPFYFGAELGIDFMNASSTIMGTPVTPAGPAFPTPNDVYTFRDNYLITLSALLHVQVAQFDVFGRIGGAWVEKTVTYGCVSLCIAAGTPQFTGSSTSTMNGWILGIGVQAPLPMMFGSLPVLVRIEYDHVFLGSRTASFAAALPATTAVAFNVSQDIDIVKASLVIPLSGR